MVTDVMAVQLDHPDWHLWQKVDDPGLWYARRLVPPTSPPMVAGPVPLEKLPAAIRDGIAARMPG